jgi:hypothetical protein
MQKQVIVASFKALSTYLKDSENSRKPHMQDIL